MYIATICTVWLKGNVALTLYSTLDPQKLNKLYSRFNTLNKSSMWNLGETVSYMKSYK